MKKTKEKLLYAFENLSIILTGFSRADIESTGLLQTYFDTIVNELGSTYFENLLSIFQKIKTNNPEQPSIQEIRQIKDLMDNAEFKQHIDQIIQLWYLGEWVVTPYSDKNYIISSQTYLEGLIWKAIAAHPMGGKQPGYATWGFPPQTFSSKPETNR